MGPRATRGVGRGLVAGGAARRGGGSRESRAGAEREPEPKPHTRWLAPRSLTARRPALALPTLGGRGGPERRRPPRMPGVPEPRASAGPRCRERARRSGAARTRLVEELEPQCSRSSPETGGGGGGGLGTSRPNLGAEADAGRGGPVFLQRLFLFLPFPPPASASAPLALPALPPFSSSHSLPPAPLSFSLLLSPSSGRSALQRESREEPRVPGWGATLPPLPPPGLTSSRFARTAAASSRSSRFYQLLSI